MYTQKHVHMNDSSNVSDSLSLFLTLCIFRECIRPLIGAYRQQNRPKRHRTDQGPVFAEGFGGEGRGWPVYRATTTTTTSTTTTTTTTSSVVALYPAHGILFHWRRDGKAVRKTNRTS